MKHTAPKAKRHRTPAGYVAPLRKRSDILAFLRTAEDSRPGYGLFAFNVKLGFPDLGFDALVKAARASHGDILPSDPAKPSARYLNECRAVYEDGENAQTAADMALETMRENVTDTDGYRMLWDGADTIAEWELNGRNGGWLVLSSFEGVRLTPKRSDCFPLWETVEQMPFPQLRRLYRFIVQCQHDFRREALTREYQYQTAFHLFENLCRRMETDEQAAAREARERAEANEREHWESRDTVTTGRA